MVPVVFPDSTALWLFSLAALALLAIPGPAVLYIVVQSAERGRRVGLTSVVGIHLGTLVHVAAATVGLSALIVASAVAFSVVKYAGAAYLVYLGIRKLLGRDGPDQIERESEPLRRAFVRGAGSRATSQRPHSAAARLGCLGKGEGGLWRRVIAGKKPACIAGRGTRRPGPVGSAVPAAPGCPGSRSCRSSRRRS